MISSRSVTDGISMSVIKSKLVYSSLILVDNILILICLLTLQQLVIVSIRHTQVTLFNCRVLHLWWQKCKANGVYDTINHFACNFAKCSPILTILSPANWMITSQLGCATLWFIINHNTYFRLQPVFWHSYLRCGGIFKYEFVANLTLSLSAKEFWKSVNIWGS